MITIRTTGLVMSLPAPTAREAWDQLRSLPDVQALGIGSIDAEVAGWEKRGYGMFAVKEARTDELVGIVGLARPYRCAGPHLVGAMHPRWRGLDEGRAEPRSLEASRAVLEWWNESHAMPVFAHVERANTRGKRLAKALGGEPVDPTVEGYEPGVMADFLLRTGLAVEVAPGAGPRG